MSPYSVSCGGVISVLAGEKVNSWRPEGLADPFSTTDSSGGSVVGHRNGHIELTRWEMLVASPELGSNQ